MLTSIGKVPVYVRYSEETLKTKVGDFAPDDVNIVVCLFETHDWYFFGAYGGDEVLGTQWVIDKSKGKVWFEIILEGAS